MPAKAGRRVEGVGDGSAWRENMGRTGRGTYRATQQAWVDKHWLTAGVCMVEPSCLAE
jgi:hypothetical protein